MTAFLSYIGEQFTRIFNMMNDDFVREYIGVTSILMALVMFYFFWQIIYSFLIRPNSSVGVLELYQQHERNATRAERRTSEASYRKERDAKMDAYRNSVMNYHKSRQFNNSLANGRTDAEYDEFWNKALARSNSIINGDPQ